MRKAFELSRRSFLILTSFLIPASKAITPHKPSSSATLFAQPNLVYVCPPCGLDCDRLEFDDPGTCPVCGMKLIEKGSAATAPAASPPAGTVRLPDGQTSVQFPFELLANSVFVQLHVNGKGPLTFGMDTGSFNSIVAAEIVGDLGIRTGNIAQGLGSGTSFTLSQIDKLDFLLPRGLELTTSQGAAVPMAGLSNLIARRFDGDIGFDVLQQLVVKIDYEKQLLTFYDANHFQYDGPGTSLPFTLWANYDPQIDGEITTPGQPAIPVKIVLDSGAGGTILTTPFVKAHRLTETMSTLASPDVGQGGGESTKWECRVAGLRVGPYTIDKPLMALSTDTVGSLAHASFDVNLGGNILKRFTVIIDYPRRLLILEPNSHFAEPFRSDASGLILKAEGVDYRTFVVRAVVPHSPASEARIKKGDVISGIKNHSIERLALWQLQDLFKKSGASYKVTIRRGERSLTAKLRLRALL